MISKQWVPLEEKTQFKTGISWITDQRSRGLNGCDCDQLLEPLSSHKSQALEALTQNSNNLACSGVSCFIFFQICYLSHLMKEEKDQGTIYKKKHHTYRGEGIQKTRWRE